MHQAGALRHKKQQTQQQQAIGKCQGRADAGHPWCHHQRKRVFERQFGFDQAHSLGLHLQVHRAGLLAIGVQGKAVPVIWAFVHVFGLAVAAATDMPASTVVFIQINLVQRIGAHAQDERVARICGRALARGVVVIDAKPDPGRTLQQAQTQVARKRRKWGLGNGVYRGLVLPVIQVGALNVIARHRGPRQGLEQQQKQENDLFHQMRLKLQSVFELPLPRCVRHLPFVAHTLLVSHSQGAVKIIEISVLTSKKH